MRVKTYTTFDDTFQKEWMRLWKESESANYCNGPQWFEAVRKSFSYDDYLIIALYAKDDLVAVAPLFKQKKYGIDIFVLSPDMFVYGLPILFKSRTKKIENTLLSELRKRKAVSYENIHEDLVKLIKKNSPTSVAIPWSYNYSMRISNNPLSPKKKKKLLYKIKGKEAYFTFKTYTGRDQKALKSVYAIDRKSRKARLGYSTFTDPTVKRFYEQLGSQFDSHFVINILYFKKKPIAYEIGFLINDTYFGSQLSVADQYSHFAPGKVLVVKLIEDISHKGVYYLDMGSGDNHLKRSLTKNVRTLYSLFLIENPMKRLYIVKLTSLRKASFDFLSQHTNMYRMYKYLSAHVSD